MKIEKTILKDVLIITPNKYEDERGFFKETYHQDRYSENGIPGNNLKFVQDNHSFSTKGVVRGMHFQLSKPQGKLVSVLSGEVFDVIVDVRRNSKTYKKFITIKLSEENSLGVYIPNGFAHGFQTLKNKTNLLYFHSTFYDKNLDSGINPLDKNLNITWPLKINSISEKDRNLSFISSKYF